MLTLAVWDKQRVTPPRPVDFSLHLLARFIAVVNVDSMAQWTEWCKSEGKLDFHALRVTFATLVVESGASVKEAQTMLRHSNPTITMNTYAKVRPGRLNEVA